MEPVVVSIAMPGGTTYEVSVQPADNVLVLREGVEKQHEVPPACILKLFQDGRLLLDEEPLASIDTAQPVFAVVSKETRIEVLLQAVGTTSNYKNLLREAAENALKPDTQTTDAGDQPAPAPQTIDLGNMPNIIDVLEEMRGQPPELPNLVKGENGTLIYSGEHGDLISPSLDAIELLSAAGVAKFARVTISVEVNSDSYNRGLGVVLESSPLMDSTVDDSGLPSYVYNGYGLSKSGNKKQNAVKFHPGMSGGCLRVEGVGGFGNSNIGFTPEAWTSSGKKFHTLHLTLGADGQNQIRFQPTKGDATWEKSWNHQLTAGRYIPAVYAFHDCGDGTLHIGRISVSVHLS